MKRFLLDAIVEGHGEERAVPILVNLWLRRHNLGRFFTARDRAIRAPGAGALKAQHNRHTDLGVEHYVERALWGEPNGILIVLDADDECIRRNQARTESLGPSFSGGLKA